MAGVNDRDKLVLAGSAFSMGVVAGLFVTAVAGRVRERARGAEWHREYDQTVSYDGNLPESLGRREPQSGEPRYGGTGALGVPPASAGVPPSEP